MDISLEEVWFISFVPGLLGMSWAPYLYPNIVQTNSSFLGSFLDFSN